MKTESPAPPRVFDVGGAIAIGVLLLVDASFGSGPHAGPRALGYVALAVAVCALAVHRPAPRVVLAVVTAAMLAYGVLIHPGAPGAFPVLAVVHTVAGCGHRVLAALGAGVYLVGALAIALALESGSGSADGSDRQLVELTLMLVGWFLAAGLTGLIEHHRRGRLAEARERAAEAERTREQVALRRADEERLRIARDLHDSLTHSIAIIKLQAGVAVHLARKRGEEVPPALLAIEAAGREAMRELRGTLEVLRSTDDPHVGRGIDDLPDLVERAAAAGIHAHARVNGSPRPLPLAVDRAAYRIVQEALTNVARHAGRGADVTVDITYADDELVIRVDDDGHPAPGIGAVNGSGSAAGPTSGVGAGATTGAAGTGFGLAGMRERVAALGGSLRTGPRPQGGFAVYAALPVSGAGAGIGVAAAGADA